MEASNSIWLYGHGQEPRAALSGLQTCEVAVIGAGIAGVCAAYQAAKLGKTVMVVDAGRIGEGVTGYTTAKVTAGHGGRYHKIGDNARPYGQANQWGVDWIASTAAAEGIDCSLERLDMRVFAETDEDLQDLREEWQAVEKTGLAVTWLDSGQYPVAAKGAISYQNQVQFQPVDFVKGLAQACERLGVRFFENTRIVDTVEEGDEGCTITSLAGGKISCDRLIVASHFPAYDPAMYFARMAPYRDYAVAVAVDDELLDYMSISISESGCAFRPFGDLLIVSGGTHKVGQADTTAKAVELESYVRGKFRVKEVRNRWSTQDNFTLDEMPYIGPITPSSERVFVATGFGGWGMSTGAIAGKMAADWIKGAKNEWTETFSPSRWKGVGGVRTFISENVNTAKHLIGDRFVDTEPISVEQLAPDSGAILEKDGQKVAAYRDAGGNLHSVSPTCTHMGCDLTWNSAERSWDCPCHGSRFNFGGKVIQGPANKDLEMK